jgi:DNA-binding XRE family transcriptional regulator
MRVEGLGMTEKGEGLGMTLKVEGLGMTGRPNHPPHFPLDSRPATPYNMNIVKTSKSRKRRTPARRASLDDSSPGELLRKAREGAGLTQADLARLLRVTQQAVAQAERSQANHTVEFLQRWAKACKRRLSIRIE